MIGGVICRRTFVAFDHCSRACAAEATNDKSAGGPIDSRHATKAPRLTGRSVLCHRARAAGSFRKRAAIRADERQAVADQRSADQRVVSTHRPGVRGADWIRTTLCVAHPDRG